LNIPMADSSKVRPEAFDDGDLAIAATLFT
jgi:hypothetical protein